jgi:hypothetical protein
MDVDRSFEIIACARRKAEKLGASMTFAVVDAAGHLVSFARMNGSSGRALPAANEASDDSNQSLSPIPRLRTPLHTEFIQVPHHGLKVWAIA